MPFVTSQATGRPLMDENGPSSLTYEKPVPRPPRSPGKTRDIRLQNRRREYIERNPDYFTSAEHEFADPLLYDALIRKFQTPAEREAEGKRKGYSRVLEGDLLRGEARLADLAQKTAQRASSSADGSPVSDPDSDPVPAAAAAAVSTGDNPAIHDPDLPAPRDKEEARDRWYRFLTNRFVRGLDDDFNYDVVDFDDRYDALERRDAEDAWFEEESPGWASEGGGAGEGEGEDGNEDGEGGRQRTGKTGETGVQDF